MLRLKAERRSLSKVSGATAAAQSDSTNEGRVHSTLECQPSNVAGTSRARRAILGTFLAASVIAAACLLLACGDWLARHAPHVIAALGIGAIVMLFGVLLWEVRR